MCLPRLTQAMDRQNRRLADETPSITILVWQLMNFPIGLMSLSKPLRSSHGIAVELPGSSAQKTQAARVAEPRFRTLARLYSGNYHGRQSCMGGETRANMLEMQDLASCSSSLLSSAI